MAKTELYQQLDIQLPYHSYPIYIGRGCLADKALLTSLIKSGQILIVTNEILASIYLDAMINCFESFQCNVVILKDGEAYKNSFSLNQIYDALIENQHHRDTTIIALGGGVIGDIAGFAAATYHRGVRYIQLPTTLLAQVDSSVGGKTAINHSQGKNMIGSFYHPYAVVMDVDSLMTLPERELIAGFGEVIKYSFIEGGGFLCELEAMLNSGISNLSLQDIAGLVARCCSIKARIVEADEKEHGTRAILNLGHTFAHALETYTEYNKWRHGEAVAIGLYCAALLSCQLNYLNPEDQERLKRMLLKAGLPVRIPAEIDLNKLIELMYSDKKVKNNWLRFILFKAPGDCFIHEGVSIDMIQKVLAQTQSKSS